MLIGKGQLFLERGKGTIAQSGNWTWKASHAIFNTVGGLGETRAEGDGHAAALQGRDTCGAGAPAVPGPGSVGRHGAASAFVPVPSWGTLGAGSQGIPARSAGGTSAAPRYGGYWVLSSPGIANYQPQLLQP